MPKYPNVKVRLTGQDSNVFNLLAVCTREARKQGVSRQELNSLQNEVFRCSSFEEALETMSNWFNVS